MSKKVLPNVLGIGASRSGTSWIYEILKSHPEIYMSTPKEINFFNLNYEKGVKWYENFFKDNYNERYIGEFTPKYLYDKKIPKLIKKNLGEDLKFIVVLRSPIQRVYSSYKKYLRDNNSKISFEEFLRSIPNAKDNGLYSQHLTNWFKYFHKKQFLILIYEEIEKYPKMITNELVDFLEVDDSFDKNLLTKTINASTTPRPYFLYLLGIKVKSFFEKFGLYTITSKIELIGKKILYVPKSKKGIIDLSKYDYIYREDIKNLEKILDRKIKSWE